MYLFYADEINRTVRFDHVNSPICAIEPNRPLALPLPTERLVMITFDISNSFQPRCFNQENPQLKLLGDMFRDP